MRAERTSTNREGIDVTIGSVDYYVEFDRVYTVSHDPSYGSDADGNRGVTMTFIDEDAAENLVVTKDGIEVPFAQLTAAEQMGVQTAVDDYLERTEPEPPEDRDPDWYDDRED